MAALDGPEQVDDLTEASARRDDTFAAPPDNYAET